MGKIIKEANTFDDVLLVPAYSEVIPNEVNLETKLTNKIKLNIPFMSASIDRKSTRLNSSHRSLSRMPSSA